MAQRRSSKKRQRQAARSQNTISIRVSSTKLLLAGIVFMLVAIVAVAGFIVGQRLNRSPAPQTAAQPPVVPAQNLPAQSPVPPTQVRPPTPTPPAGKKLYDAPPPMTIDVTKAYTATIKTEQGDIVIRLRPDLAPQHVNNFVFLSRNGFYDRLWFHRVIPGFIAQAGDPKGDTTGGPGYLLPHEITDTPHKAGTVAMARLSDPFNPDRDSSGSQFYIVLEDSQQASDLDGQYTIFGEVVEGLDVARNLTPRDPQDAYPGDQIKTIEITEE